MIIKEKSIKDYTNLERVLRYVLSKEAMHGFVHTRYIRSDRKYAKELSLVMEDAQAFSIVKEERLQNMLAKYIQNDKGRIHKRDNETKFHHSIISFHKKDVLSEQELLKVAKEFIKQRYPKSVVTAVSHHDTDHYHIHMVGSHVHVGTGITNYHTKKQFSEIKQYMERWQEQELDLKYSSVQHVKKKIKP
ncbi:relaxase/mobilization nuclease domain-containing protein [Aquimarina hainanensis]|uniref:Relaxase/mobilization nuclease domain-containing protein n=1 Tax=Aquimarina hainanensis TaxID=1578017 RepID=A0ABW5N7D6_9FLAO